MVLLSAGILAQSAPPSCPSDRPVDEIIAEIHKQQSSKKHRNSNPLPDVFCIGGWCRGHASKQKPPSVPESAPESAPPTKDLGNNDGTSSSRIPVDKCDEAMEQTLKAAHDVEVGDYSFSTDNYGGALMRYKDAAEEKPGDAAIHVRWGRALEKLGQFPEAMEQYKAAQELAGPKKWSDEAKAALTRLEQHQASGKN